MRNLLNIIDTMWIEWKSCGNLLATCGSDREVRIYDRREGKIVKRFEKVHEGSLVECFFLASNPLLIRFSVLREIKFSRESHRYRFKRQNCEDCGVHYGKTHLQLQSS